MITAKQLQTGYTQLYTELREYIWPGEVVSNIADLEVSVYRAFPDIAEVRTNFGKLKTNCRSQIKDDDALSDAFDNFEELLKDGDTIYSKLDIRLKGAEK